jgi:hypothetical protein
MSGGGYERQGKGNGVFVPYNFGHGAAWNYGGKACIALLCKGKNSNGKPYGYIRYKGKL